MESSEGLDEGLVERDDAQEHVNFRKWVAIGLQRIENHLELSVSDGLSKEGREKEWQGAWRLLEEMKREALRSASSEGA